MRRKRRLEACEKKRAESMTPMRRANRENGGGKKMGQG